MIAMKSSYWCWLFFADLLAELSAIAYQSNDLRYFTKPLLVIFLLAWFLGASSKFTGLRFYIVPALGFSWAGDVFLLPEHGGAYWFIAGLASFLAAHIMYTLFFLRIRKKHYLTRPLNFIVIVLVSLYAVSLYILLYRHIENLRLPVAVYASAISVMLISAIHAFNRPISLPGRWCITGAVLFVVSDSLLSVNRFYHSFSNAGIFIMLSYGLAQFALTKGSLLYLAGVKGGGMTKH
jgi:uncharacterized membrane protein YhhN